MIIGLCGAGFPDVRRALAVALPGAQIVEVDEVDPGEVDVLVPLGASVDERLMDPTRPRLIQQFGVGLQGVDIDAARNRGIRSRASPPASPGTRPQWPRWPSFTC